VTKVDVFNDFIRIQNEDNIEKTVCIDEIPQYKVIETDVGMKNRQKRQHEDGEEDIEDTSAY
jgi:hypothetical protein